MILRISHRIVVLVVTILFVVSLGCYVAYNKLNEHLIVTAQEKLQFLHKNESVRISSLIESELTIVSALAADANLSDVLHAHFQTRITPRAPKRISAGNILKDIDLSENQPLQKLSEHLLEKIRLLTPHIQSLNIIGKRGYSLGLSSNHRTDISNTDSKRAESTNKKRVFVKNWVTETNENYVEIALPLLDRGKRKVGELLVHLQSDFILDSLGIYDQLGSSTEAFLLAYDDGNGRVLGLRRFQNKNSNLQSDLDADRHITDDASNTQVSTLLRTQDYRGIDALHAVSEISGTNWRLVLKIDTDEILATAIVIRKLMTSVVILSIFILLLAVLFWFYPLSKRLKKLSEISNKISNRDFDFQIADKSKDEIGILSRHIDNLAAELKSSTSIHVAVQEQLSYRDSHDEISGLLNRENLMNKATEMASNLHEGCISALAVAFEINPNLNSEKYNETKYKLLTGLGELCQEQLPASAQVGRWSENLIMFIVPNADESGLMALQSELNIRIKEDSQFTSGSEIAIYYGSSTTHDLTHLDDMFRQAIDVITLQKELDDASSDICLSSASLVEEAINNDRVEVWYQPIIHVTDNVNIKLIGAEAMVRIRSTSGEIVSAESFMPHVQNHPISATLDKVIAERAISTACEWKVEGKLAPNFTTSINLSRKSMSDLNFAEFLLETSNKYNYDLNGLTLDIPHPSTAIQFENIVKFKSIGLKLAIDDIGVQNFSVSELCRIQPNFLKIDWNKVIKESEASGKLSAIHFLKLLSFFKSIKINLIAKNIESEGQKKAMSKQGMFLMQGYFFGSACTPSIFIDQWGNKDVISKTA